MVDLILVLFVFLVKCFNDDSFGIVMYIDYVLCFFGVSVVVYYMVLFLLLWGYVLLKIDECSILFCFIILL